MGPASEAYEGSLVVRNGGALSGRVRVPGDKSISHRTLLLGCLAQGKSRVQGFLPSNDCLATLDCVRALGTRVEAVESDYQSTLIVFGRGLRNLRCPEGPLDCSRSGTTMRLLAGILAGQSFRSVVTGDPQLLRRPMERIARPLQRMGAEIRTTNGRAPLTIRGGQLQGSEHVLPVASAQVKSAILLAGLYADGPTVVHQPGPARDHTELLLRAMTHSKNVDIDGLSVTLRPPTSPLAPFDLIVPGDVSSASYLLTGAVLAAEGDVSVEWVGVNPTRTGYLDVLRSMGADLAIEPRPDQGGEPVSDIGARASALAGTVVEGQTVVRMIDEFPLLAVAATQSEGTTVVRDAAELRVKETDRIAVTARELNRMGAHIEPQRDGFIVSGPTKLAGTVVDSHSDHRVAMALVIAGLVAGGETTVLNTNCIADSFPGFADTVRSLGASVE